MASREIVKIDALSNRTTQAFDAANRKIRVTDARGYSTTTVYDGAGRTVGSIDALLNRSTFVFDAAGRQIVSENALGNRTTTIYDAGSRKVAAINPLGNRTSFGFDAANRQLRVKDALGNVTTTVYDAAGRAIANVNPLAYRTTHIFDAAGQQVATQDTNLNRTTSVFDPARRVQATVDANLRRTTNVYDANSRRIAIVDARSNRTSFGYDQVANEILITDALGNRTTSVYDNASRKILRIDARHNRTSYAYDATRHETVRKYPDGTRVTQTYNAMRKRTVLQDATGRYTAAYDPLDRLSRRTNPANKCITYVYDGVSQRRRLVDPDGGIFTTVYDPAGEITKIVNPEALTTTFAYDQAGRRVVKELGNGTRASFTWDNASRLSRLVNIKSSGTTISSFGYTYDKTGRRTGVTEASGDRVTWTYDRTYQLINEQRDGVNNYNVTYTYDPAGNRSLKNDSGALTTSTYDNANRLVYVQDSSGRTTFTFDTSGNQSKQVSPTLQVTTSIWDFENLNTAVLLPDTTRVTSTFDADKLRVEKDASTGNVKFIYDGQNILLETDGTGLSQAVYTLEPKEFGKLISQRQLQSGTWVPIYCAFDGLGSADSLTDGAQVITDTYTYQAFGKVQASTGSTPNRFVWVGELMYLQDSETGEVQLHVRPVQPQYGRFKCPDPKPIERRANKYDFVRNDPVNEVDPSGLDPDAPAGDDSDSTIIPIDGFTYVIEGARASRYAWKGTAIHTDAEVGVEIYAPGLEADARAVFLSLVLQAAAYKEARAEADDVIKSCFEDGKIVRGALDSFLVANKTYWDVSGLSPTPKRSSRSWDSASSKSLQRL